jgi:hypothetical protein
MLRAHEPQCWKNCKAQLWCIRHKLGIFASSLPVCDCLHYVISSSSSRRSCGCQHLHHATTSNSSSSRRSSVWLSAQLYLATCLLHCRLHVWQLSCAHQSCWRLPVLSPTPQHQSFESLPVFVCDSAAPAAAAGTAQWRTCCPTLRLTPGHHAACTSCPWRWSRATGACYHGLISHVNVTQHAA